jgi:hypothetical protein
MGIDAFLKRAGVDFANVEVLVLVLVLRDCNRCRLRRIGGGRVAEYLPRYGMDCNDTAALKAR